VRDRQVQQDQFTFPVYLPRAVADPHANGTWPNTRTVAHRLCEGAGMDESEVAKLMRGNAIECYGLERFGIES